jgi:hypothetical protein
MNNNTTAIIQVFYPEREAFLGKILDSLALVSAIEKIIVWINGNRYRMRYARPNLQTIHCSFDTLIGQYAAAFVAPSPMIYCQNDDLVVEPSSISRMLTTAEKLPTMIVGLLGSNVARDSATPYSASESMNCGHCDMLVGRAWAADKQALISGFERSLALNINPERGEDMFWTWKRAWVEPNCKWEDLPTNGVGLCHEANHAAERDRWAQHLIGCER